MTSPILLWFRRDLRLSDNPALAAALAEDGPMIPVYVLDESEAVRPIGAAGRWWLDKSLRALSAALEARGSRLILRQGPAEEVLPALVEETGAGAVFWNRLYDPGVVDRDKALKASLPNARSCNGSLLLEPWEVRTKQGEPYKVFTPFWRAARALVDVGSAHRPPAKVPAPKHWPKSSPLDDWRLHPANPDWSAGFDWTPGEDAAHARLGRFIEDGLADYARGRDRPAEDGSSRLSPYLHWGELGPRQVWRRVMSAAERGAVPHDTAEKFLAELGWREFNHQLLFHHPDLRSENFRPAFDALKWRHAPAELAAWKEGRTGFPIVDAGLRQLWTTGWMHNRVRMIVASFLVKDLLIDWREGERWFWDTLVDAEEANNILNWQWVAGTGADAQPFFRIFNPTAQAERYDPGEAYVRRWVPEVGGPGYPAPMVDHATARDRALEALKSTRA